MSQLPPGPKIPRLVDYFQGGVVSSVTRLRCLAAKYGDTFRLRYRGGAMTFTGDPEAIRTIYSSDPDCFDVYGVDATMPVFGTNSVVVTSGERHRRDRKLLVPHFKVGAMRTYGSTIAEVAAAAATRWTVGQVFSMLETAQAITLDIIIRIVFGVQGEQRIQRTREAVRELIGSIHPIIIIFPFLRHDFGGIGSWARNRRMVSALNAILAEEIRARRETGGERQDILSRMMIARFDDGTAMADAEILDQLRALLFAGHETTAAAVAWTFYWVHREPAVLKRVLEEIDGLGPDPQPDAFTSLPFLEAVCLEALRLHPPVLDVARITRKPFELLGFTIPAGEGIRPSMSILHARTDLYPEPDRFQPERFLERKFSPFEYIPFGGGGRRCLGATFAMYEMKVVLGTLLRVYRLRLASFDPVADGRLGLTMGPLGGVPMILDGQRAETRPPATSKSATCIVANVRP